MTDELSIRPKADLATADPAATRVLSKANALVLGAGLKADAQLRGDRPVIDSLSLYPDGQHIVGLVPWGPVVIWNLKSGKVVAELNNGIDCGSIAPCPAGPRIACCSGGDLWIADPAAFDVCVWETEGFFDAIEFSPDGHWLLAAGPENISLFSADGDKTWSAPQLVQVWENVSLAEEFYTLVAWASDSRAFAASFVGSEVVRGEVDKSGALEELRPAGYVDGLWFARDGDLWWATKKGLTRWSARSVDNFDYQDLPGDLPAHLIGSWISQVSIGLERDGLFICAEELRDEIVDGPGPSFGLQGSVASGRFNRVSLGAARVSAIAPTPEECCAVVSTEDGRNRLIRFDTGEALELGAPKRTSNRRMDVWHDSSAALIVTASHNPSRCEYGGRISACRELDGSLCAELDARRLSGVCALQYRVLAVGYGKIAVSISSSSRTDLEIFDVRSGQTEFVIPDGTYSAWASRFTMGAETVAVASKVEGWLSMWSTSTGTLMSEIEMPNGEDCSPIVLYKDAVAVVNQVDDVAVLHRWTERTGVWQATELRIVSAPLTGWMQWYFKANWQSEGWLALPVAGGVGGFVLLNLAASDLAARRVRVPGEDDGDFILNWAVSSDGCRLAVVKGAKILVINVASGEVHWSCDTGPDVKMLSFSRSGHDLLWVENVGRQLRYKRQRL